MKERDDTVYLRHILDAIARIEGYLSGVNRCGGKSKGFLKSKSTILFSGRRFPAHFQQAGQAVPIFSTKDLISQKSSDKVPLCGISLYFLLRYSTSFSAEQARDNHSRSGSFQLFPFRPKSYVCKMLTNSGPNYQNRFLISIWKTQGFDRTAPLLIFVLLRHSTSKRWYGFGGSAVAMKCEAEKQKRTRVFKRVSLLGASP